MGRSLSMVSLSPVAGGEGSDQWPSEHSVRPAPGTSCPMADLIKKSKESNNDRYIDGHGQIYIYIWLGEFVFHCYKEGMKRTGCPGKKTKNHCQHGGPKPSRNHIYIYMADLLLMVHRL